MRPPSHLRQPMRLLNKQLRKTSPRQKLSLHRLPRLMPRLVAKNSTPCAVCHSVDEGGAARVGPNLFAVYGQPAGQRDGFAFSPALRDSGLTWDDQTLDAFIENPQTLVARNRMAYPGQRDAQKTRQYHRVYKDAAALSGLEPVRDSVKIGTALDCCLSRDRTGKPVSTFPDHALDVVARFFTV